MGRRATSTTKGGKFMNPTDQARKEARRRELKKNKKQRLAVRQAVIKTKDPQLMITELESLDDMELNPSNTNQYNEKVIKDKRRKLLENLIRIVDFYFKEEPSRGREFKLMVEAYKQNRKKKENYYESVQNAQKVEIGAIPLPDAPFATPQLQDIPLPGLKPQGILKKMPPGPPSGLPPALAGKKLAPGPPPGFPPSKKVFVRGVKPGVIPGIPMHSVRSGGVMEDMPYDPEEGPEFLGGDDRRADDDDEEEFHHRDDDEADIDHLSDDDAGSSRRPSRRGVRFADDDKDKETTKPLPSNITPLQAMMLKLAGQSVPAPPENTDYDDEDKEETNEHAKDRSRPPGPPPGLPPGPPPGMPPGIMQNPSGILPPGPPPGRPPTVPPGLPPGISHRGGEQGVSFMPNPNVLSAPPSLIHRPAADKEEEPQAATISAKPQLTANPKGDTTRFMPTSLRVRRETKGRGAPVRAGPELPTQAERQKAEKKRKAAKSNADAAYDSFMKEMQGLL